MEIVEGLCESSSFECNRMVEEHEELFETWWFKRWVLVNANIVKVSRSVWSVILASCFNLNSFITLGSNTTFIKKNKRQKDLKPSSMIRQADRGINCRVICVQNLFHLVNYGKPHLFLFYFLLQCRKTKHPDLHKWFCIETIKVCCPKGTFGSDCNGEEKHKTAICTHRGVVCGRLWQMLLHDTSFLNKWPQ